MDSGMPAPLRHGIVASTPQSRPNDCGQGEAGGLLWRLRSTANSPAPAAFLPLPKAGKGKKAAGGRQKKIHKKRK